MLDVLRDEKLQENARVVGDHLRGRLLALAERHPIIGAVHGMGLYLGVEMVRDRVRAGTGAGGDLRDLRADARARRHHAADLRTACAFSRSSRRSCIGIADADFFVDTLDRVLTEGW